MKEREKCGMERKRKRDRQKTFVLAKIDRKKLMRKFKISQNDKVQRRKCNSCKMVERKLNKMENCQFSCQDNTEKDQLYVSLRKESELIFKS